MATESLDGLIQEVRLCRDCENLGLPFASDSAGGPAFRFPPTIGARTPVPLLFVGINPRCSDPNREFHQVLQRDQLAFAELAGNRYRGQRYIQSERHYAMHIRVARALFPDRPFEDVAAVTELFFCASESAVGLPVRQSPCANKFFERVLALVQPSIVFAVGRSVEEYLEWRFGKTFMKSGNATKAIVVEIPHPAAFGEKSRREAAAIELARAHLNSVGENRKFSAAVGSSSSSESQDPRGDLAQGGGKLSCSVSYTANRLHFKRQYIDPLAMHDVFAIVTPHMAWRMTKADFYRVFDNVVSNGCYLGPRGEYHYPTPPAKAAPFRIK